MSGFPALAQAAARARAERPLVPLALATLVDVEGSSYRQPGARLLVDGEARVLAGAISGGCLEGDVAARAAEVCASGQAITLRYDLRADLETIWGYGAACDGIAHIVLEPLRDASWLEAAAQVRAARTGGAVLTIAPEGAAEGGVEGEPRAATLADDAARPARVAGTVALLRGGTVTGVWEAVGGEVGAGDALDLARASRLSDVAQHTAHPQVEAVGSSRWFVEPLMPVVSLFVVGAGRGAEAFARIATTLGWEVTVLDHREALLEALDLPAGVRRVAARAEDGAALVPSDARTAVALLTHIFDVDSAWLAALLPRHIGYLGVLGSRQRAARLVESVRVAAEASTEPGRLLHAPIGLDLGGETPESIALAAIAEIEAVMHARPGGYLRNRESPIHTRTPTPVVACPAPSVDARVG